jgi:hypothetical protein
MGSFIPYFSDFLVMLSYSNQADYADEAQRDAVTGRRGQMGALEIAGAFERTVPLLTETLSRHWSTGQGTRVRHILWSIYTCNHLVNLGEACSGLDRRLAEAVAVAITARLILGPEVETVLRGILQNSGEFARFEREEVVTPGHLPVIYPPAAAGPEELRRIADAMDHRARGADHP